MLCVIVSDKSIKSTINFYKSIFIVWLIWVIAVVHLHKKVSINNDGQDFRLVGDLLFIISYTVHVNTVQRKLKQDVQRTTARSTGRDEKKRTLLLRLVISNRDLLHDTLHHATKLLAVISFLTFRNMSHISSDLVQAYHGKFQSSMKRAKLVHVWPFSIVICFMVLCITPPNFRPIAEILKESER